MALTHHPEQVNQPSPNNQDPGKASGNRRRGHRGVVAAIGGLVAAVAVAGGVLAARGGAGHASANSTPRVSASAAPSPSYTEHTSANPKPVIEDLGKPNSEVAAVAEKYGLQLKEVSYSTYLPGTQKFAEARKMPAHYYDLTSLTQPLKLADYKALAPVIIANTFLSNNTDNVHIMDTGATTLFGTGTPTTIPKYLIAPETGVNDYGAPTGRDSYAATAQVTQGPFDPSSSPFSSQYEGREDIIHFSVKTPVLGQMSTDINGNPIDSFTSGSTVMIPGYTETLNLQFDPSTNAMIGEYYNIAQG